MPNDFVNDDEGSLDGLSEHGVDQYTGNLVMTGQNPQPEVDDTIATEDLTEHPEAPTAAEAGALDGDLSLADVPDPRGSYFRHWR